MTAGRLLSWSLIDSSSSPKLAYHLVKSAYQPLFGGFAERNDRWDAVVINDTGERFTGSLKIQWIEDRSGDIRTHTEIDLNIPPHRQRRQPIRFSGKGNDRQNRIFILTIYDHNGKMMARNCLAGQRWKYFQLPQAPVRMTKKGNRAVVVSSDQTLFYLDLYHPDIVFHQRGILLLPGEEITVSYTAENDQAIRHDHMIYYSINKYLSSKNT